MPGNVIAAVAAYIIGSIPTAYIVARLRKGVDIREVGSRNMGAMNVFYNIGVAEGLLVLAVDIGKGAAAVFLARWLGAAFTLQLAAGVAVVLGHAFPAFLRLRGGKGGATSIGVLATLMPWGIPYYIGLVAAAMAVTRFLTLSYSLAFICFPFVAWLVYHSGALVAFTAGLLIIPGIRYIPRVMEMRSTGGSWRRVVFRSSVRDRL